MSTDINELFNRDPMDLTDQDIDAIIAHMRERRKDFKAAQLTGKKPAQKKLTKTQEKLANMKLAKDLKL